MPRVSIWLPEELHRQAKELGLPISELAQRAIRDELLRREKRAAMGAYLAELDAELGPATPEEEAEAEAWAKRVLGEERPKAKRRSA